jgi:hypothetical protein
MSIESGAYNLGKIRTVEGVSETTGMLGKVEGNLMREDVEERSGMFGWT